ncbi:DUF4258 domain-containing protein [Lentibacillus salinarum]|uniref:DUF4258 domain-containing protein n=1 Tax=Lentibacillus salinarum TaxID=446820 RepID=A0ABW3ZYB4_9BACI
MSCQDPEGCHKKHTQWKEWQERIILEGEEIHEEIIRDMDENGTPLSMSKHGGKRELYRAFSPTEINNAVRNGWVIEYSPKRMTLHILHHFKVGKGSYRPIHVVIGYKEKLKVVTVYDPRSKAWKWDRNYQERVCFCN